MEYEAKDMVEIMEKLIAQNDAHTAWYLQAILAPWKLMMSDAAKGLQHDRTVGAKFARRECVTQLMDKDRNEAGEHEQQGLQNRRGRVGAQCATDQYQGDPEEGLNLHRNAKNGKSYHASP